jgi:uncharacterized protein YbjT (DUF2867 family)
MAKVLVTGGTGTLGRQLVARLVERDHEVLALSRKRPKHDLHRAQWIHGNVLDATRLEVAAAGVDVIVHAASSPSRRARRTEEEGTANAVAAARTHGAHLIYVSIVGVDAHRFPYYRAKWAAEQIIERSDVAWTIQRATQFFDLIEQFLRFRVFPATRKMRFQPIDTGEVADRIADLVDAGPTGRAPDVGGPEVVSLRELAAIRKRVTGRRAILIPTPPVGFLEDFDLGRHLCPAQRVGRRSWEEWLRRSS